MSARRGPRIKGATELGGLGVKRTIYGDRKTEAGWERSNREIITYRGSIDIRCGESMKTTMTVQEWKPLNEASQANSVKNNRRKKKKGTIKTGIPWTEAKRLRVEENDTVMGLNI